MSDVEPYDARPRCAECGQVLKAPGAACARCDVVCAHCGLERRLHVVVTASGAALCPTSTFFAEADRRSGKAEAS
jgi:hypothetical protein